MRLILPLLAVLAAVLAAAESDLDAMLAGHATGPAQHCINPRRINGQTLVNPGVIIFKTYGRQYYRTAMAPSCPAIRSDRAIATRDYGQGFCEHDIFEVFDPVSRITYGSCTFGAFTPYELPPRK